MTWSATTGGCGPCSPRRPQETDDGTEQFGGGGADPAARRPRRDDAFEGVVTVRVIEDLYAFTWTYRDEPLLSHLGRYHD